MKYLKIKAIIIVLLIANSITAQDTGTPSNLKDFVGIWQFTLPENSNDTTFTSIKLFSSEKLLKIMYWHHSKEIYSRERIIGFFPPNKKITKLSDLKDVGQRMWFYEPNPKAPNDSIKYYRQASPSCFASYNGLGTDNFDPPAKGEPNYFLFNFNGREYERHEQLTHLPNFIVVALLKNKKELQKVEMFLNVKYTQIKIAKSFIYSTPNAITKMFLLKGDPLEVLEQKDNWLRIRYYGKKTIEGWIKKEDVAVE